MHECDQVNELIVNRVCVTMTRSLGKVTEAKAREEGGEEDGPVTMWWGVMRKREE